MLIRAAVATVLICIVVLLCSACGLPLLLERPEPSIQREDFVLWQTGADQAERVVGYANLDGNFSNVRASAYLFPTPCRPDAVFYFDGKTKANLPSVVVTLHPNRYVFGAQDLTVTLRPGTQHRWVVSQPFVLSYDNVGCPGSPILHAEAREGPIYRYSWSGSLPDPNTGITINMYQSQANSTNTAKLWARLSESLPACHASGLFSADVQATATASPHTSDFDIGHHVILRIDGLPPNLNAGPPSQLDLRLTFLGGACDRQSFNAHLSMSRSY